MLEQLSCEEFDEWIEYYKLEPFGSHALIEQSAHQLAFTAEIHRDSKVRPKSFDTSEFMPWDSSHHKPASSKDVTIEDRKHAQNQVQAMFQAWVEASAGKKVDENGNTVNG